jgi:hypothetical protein
MNLATQQAPYGVFTHHPENSRMMGRYSSQTVQLHDDIT